MKYLIALRCCSLRLAPGCFEVVLWGLLLASPLTGQLAWGQVPGSHVIEPGSFGISSRHDGEAALMPDAADSAESPLAEHLPPSPVSVSDEQSELLKRLEVLEKAEQKRQQSELKKTGWVDVSNEKWTVKIGGQIFADYGNWLDASPAIEPGAQDFFNWRRIRLQVEGTGYGVYDFRVQFDLDPDGDTSNGIAGPFVAMKDVYMGINELPGNSRVRFGNFFVPFSLDQLTPLPFTQFMERSIPTAGIFSPDREVGMALYHLSDDLNRSLSLGVFFDEIPESTKRVVDDNQGLRLSARGVWLPYYDEPSDGRYLIHTGVGYIYTQDRNDSVRFRARPGEIRDTQRLIDSGNIAAGAYSVVNLELASVAGPFSVQSELSATSVNRINDSSVMLYGAYVQASYFLTGEHRRYLRDGPHLHHFGRMQPYTNFFLIPGNAGWGAWEAKARWSYLTFDEVQRGKYNELTMGMNWYLHENSRVMFEWIHPWTSGNATVGNNLIGSTQADLLAIRMQFTF